MITILHNIRSLHNVGSIFRTADAFGVKKIYLSGITPSPVDSLGKPRQQFIKVSLGAEKSVLWEKVKTPNVIIDKLKKEGYKIFAVEQNKKSIPYYKAKLKKNSKVALIMGNEVRGISKSILDKSDKILEIPMMGKKESLNVAIAFGIVASRMVY